MSKQHHHSKPKQPQEATGPNKVGRCKVTDRVITCSCPACGYEQILSQDFEWGKTEVPTLYECPNCSELVNVSDDGIHN